MLSVFSGLLLVSLLLTGCIGGGGSALDTSAKDLDDVIHKLAQYWYQDIEKFAGLFNFPLTIGFYTRIPDSDELDWWDEEVDQNRFIALVKDGWPEQSETFSIKMEVAKADIFLNTNSKSAIIDFFPREITRRSIDGEEKEEIHDGEFSLRLTASKNSAGKWHFDQYPYGIFVKSKPE